jgi:hypothetical protein
MTDKKINDEIKVIDQKVNEDICNGIADFVNTPLLLLGVVQKWIDKGDTSKPIDIPKALSEIDERFMKGLSLSNLMAEHFKTPSIIELSESMRSLCKNGLLRSKEASAKWDKLIAAK